MGGIPPSPRPAGTAAHLIPLAGLAAAGIVADTLFRILGTRPWLKPGHYANSGSSLDFATNPTSEIRNPKCTDSGFRNQANAL